MTREQLDFFLTDSGYNKITSNLAEYSIYYRFENQGIVALSIIDCSTYQYMTPDQYVFVKQKVRELFAGTNQEVHILSLIISNDMERDRTLCAKDPFCWYILPARDQLIIYETQTPDFYGMKGEIELFLQKVVSGQFQIRKEMPTKPEKEELSWLPIGVIVLVVANVLLFLLSAITGNMLYNIGDLSVIEVVKYKQIYRIFTSMFLHVDVNHLFNNMLVLYYIGAVVEKQYGTIRFWILYFLAGIAGGLVSMAYELSTMTFFHSVGASGAVFGVMGALLFQVLINKGHFRQMSLGRVAFMIAFSLYAGFTSEFVNNAAHLGGLVTGFLTAAILWLTIRKDRKNEG